MDTISEMNKLFKQTEKDLESKDKTISQHEQSIKQLQDNIHELENQLKIIVDDIDLWKDTASANESLLTDYKNRELNALEMLQRMIIKYVDDHEIYIQVSKDGYGRILRSFRGLQLEDKEELKTFIEQKMVEIETLAETKR